MSSYRILETVEELAADGASWAELQSHLGLPTSRYDWWLTCSERVAADESPYVLAALENELPVAVVALTRPQNPTRPLVGAGQAHREPFDVAYSSSSPASLTLIADRLVESGLAIRLERVPLDSPLVDVIRKAYRGRGLVLVRPRRPCPYIACDAGEATVIGNLSASLRSDLRRASRRAAALGRVSFEMHEPRSASDLAPIWQQALKIEAAGWKGDRGAALLVNEGAGGFFDVYARRAANRGALRIAFLKIDEEPAAMQIAIEDQQRFWLLRIGYLQEYARCSPGTLLMEWTLRHVARRELLSYEFLGQTEAWTERWTRSNRSTVAIFAYPYTVPGVLVLTRSALRGVANRTKRWLRSGAER